MSQNRKQGIVITERFSAITDDEITKLIERADSSCIIVPGTKDISCVSAAVVQTLLQQGNTLVAYDENRAVGLIHLAQQQRRWDTAVVLTIDVLLVEASKDSRTIAERLVANAEDVSREAVALEVQLNADASWSVISFLRELRFITVDMTEQPRERQIVVTWERQMRQRYVWAEAPVAVLVFNVPQFLSVYPLLKGLETANIAFDLVMPHCEETSTANNDGYNTIFDRTKKYIQQRGYECLDVQALQQTVYQIVMAPYADDFLSHGHHTIKYYYGYAVKGEKSYFLPSLLSFDYILCRGLYEESQQRNLSTSCVIGETRALRFTRKPFNPNKDIIVLYAPTYAQGLDAKEVIAALKALPSKYRIILKLHPGTDNLKAEKDNARLLRESFDTVYDGDEDLFQLMSDADILLSDYSGAIFNALSVDLPVALLRMSESSTFTPSAILEELIENDTLPCAYRAAELQDVLEAALSPSVRTAQHAIKEQLCTLAPEEGIRRFTVLVRDILADRLPVKPIEVGECLHKDFLRMDADMKEKDERIEAMLVATQRVCYEKMTLEQNCTSLRVSVDKAKAEIQQLSSEYDMLQKEKEKVTTEKQQLLSECNRMMEEKERAATEAQQLLSERDALLKEKKEATNEIQWLLSECDRLQAETNKAEANISCLLSEREDTGRRLQRLSAETVAISALRSMKIAHFFAKTTNQFLHGNRQKRQEYIKWLFCTKKRRIDVDPTMNPLFRIMEPIQILSDDLKKQPALQPANVATYVLDEAISQYAGETLIVLPELADWNIPLFQRPQQLAKSFAALGVMFVYTTPNDLDGITGPQAIEKNCVLIRDRDTADVVRLAKKYHKRVILDICSTDNLHFSGWIEQWKDCDCSILYEYIDEISDQITGKVPPETMERHRAFLRDANVYVVATADKLYQEVITLRGSEINCLHSGNGVDCEHFQQGEDLTLVPNEVQAILERKRPVVGYFGAIANWFDFDLIMKAAKKRPQYDFLLIGPQYGNHDLPILKKLRCMRNVHLVGTISYQALPQVARHFTVATIPFLLNDITESTSPIKLFEYMALGKPVVTTAMRECYKHPVHIAETREEYVHMLDIGIKEASNPAIVQQLLDEAEANSWRSKAKELMKLLGIEENRHPNQKQKQSYNEVRQVEHQKVETKETEALMAEMDTLRNAQQLMVAEQARELERIKREQRLILENGYRFATSKAYHVAHLMSRVNSQFLHGSLQEKKAFVRWLAGRLRGKTTANHQYNPLLSMLQQLDLLNQSIGCSAYTQPVLALTPEKEDHIQDEEKLVEEQLKKYSGRYVCILLSPVDFKIDLFQRPQQIAIAMAEMGVLTFYSTPNYLDKVDSVWEERPNLLLIPNRISVERIIGLTKKWEKASIVEVLSTDNSKTMQDMLLLQQQADHVVYEYIDEVSEEITGTIPEAILQRHKAVLESPAFSVLCTAEKLFEDVVARRRSEENVLLSSNGVDIQHFQQPKMPLEELPEALRCVCEKGKPIIGYYGAIATWFDFELFAQAAKERPQYEFVAIGPIFHDSVGKTVKEAMKQDNLTFCDPVEYKRLPGAAQYFTATTIPFLVNEITESTSPIKIFEYMAMGKPVVTTEMRECHKYPVYVAQNAQEYIQMIDLAVADASKEEKIDELCKCAARYSWNACASDVLHAACPKMEERMEWLVLAAIDWDFRFQRPQQLAQKWALCGDHVTYVNPDLCDTAEASQRGNVDLLKLGRPSNETFSMFLLENEKEANQLFEQLDDYLTKHQVRTANVLVQYPTWYLLAKKLKEKYNFRIFLDYIDEYEGFNGTNNNVLIRPGMQWLRENSEAVFATSQYLFDRIGQTETKCLLVRNGTESAHFEQAKGNKQNGDKIIGYYGAVADWFDQELVIHAAKKLPNCCFQVIGDSSTVDVSAMKRVPNIQLIPETPYQKLPDYLQNFDVAIIPFKASLDLIKATNPVKFYEYLSAGKKVVTTEICELMSYRDEYVLMSNNPDAFADAIRRCLDNEDGLASEAERVAFAKTNDWQQRAQVMRDEVKNQYPKVSIIVLTWNNAKYNIDCLRSIVDYSAYPNMEVIVVDNASMDGTVEALKKFASGCQLVHLILNKENLGFAAGMNKGIRQATGDYLVILNNDTLVTPGWLDGMMKYLRNPKIGAVGSMTNMIANEAKVEPTYQVVAEVNRFALLRSKECAGQAFDIKVLALFCTMMKRDVIEKVGMLDEQFKVGMFEDDDYSIRLHKQGYRTVCAEDVFIHHYGMGGFKQLSEEEYMRIFTANRERFEKKHGLEWEHHIHDDV